MEFTQPTAMIWPAISKPAVKTFAGRGGSFYPKAPFNDALLLHAERK
jgi:hypothetical protein